MSATPPAEARTYFCLRCPGTRHTTASAIGKAHAETGFFPATVPPVTLRRGA